VSTRAAVLDPRVRRELVRLARLMACKGADYGTDADPLANCRAATALGLPAWVGVALRLGDKYARLQRLVRRRLREGAAVGAVADETVADTLRDLAGYSLIALALLPEDERAGEG